MNRFTSGTLCRTAVVRAGAGMFPYPSRGSTLCIGRRHFFDFLRSKPRGVKLEEVLFDKETPHYYGTIFGFSADTIIFYAKTGASLLAIIVVVGFFIKGYAVLSRFSLATVARLGFMSGFCCCAVLYTVAIALIRRFKINPNAVYNQSIAIVMRNEKVLQHLGTHPRTGDFKAYSHSGGFRLPLIRRVRSGSYELADLLGLKPRRMQMMFILRNPTNGREGLVTCEVRRETTGFLTSTNSFRSLSVTLTDTGRTMSPQTVVVIGRPEDVVYRGLMQLEAVTWDSVCNPLCLRLAYEQSRCPYNTPSENMKHKNNLGNTWFSSIIHGDSYRPCNTPPHEDKTLKTSPAEGKKNVPCGGVSSSTTTVHPSASTGEVPAACAVPYSAPCPSDVEKPVVVDSGTVPIDVNHTNKHDLIENSSRESSKVFMNTMMDNEIENKTNNACEEHSEPPQERSLDDDDDALGMSKEKNGTHIKTIESIHMDKFDKLEKLIGSTPDRLYEKLQGAALKVVALDSLNQQLLEKFPRYEMAPQALDRDKERQAELAIYLYSLKKQVKTLKEMWEHEESERQKQRKVHKDSPKTIRVEIFRAYEKAPIPYKKKPFAPLRPPSSPFIDESSKVSSSFTSSLEGSSLVSSSSIRTEITNSSFKSETYSDDFE